MFQYQINRRLFLFSTALISAASCAPAAGREKHHQTKQGLSGGQQKALLDAMVDTFVPRDQDPGGVEAGVPDMLLNVFANNHRLEAHGQALMTRLQEIARIRYCETFANLDIDARESIMTDIYRSYADTDSAARNAIYWLRVEILGAFYQTPEGQAMLGYHHPYPRGYTDYAQPLK